MDRKSPIRAGYSPFTHRSIVGDRQSVTRGSCVRWSPSPYDTAPGRSSHWGQAANFARGVSAPDAAVLRPYRKALTSSPGPSTRCSTADVSVHGIVGGDHGPVTVTAGPGGSDRPHLR